MAKTPSTPRAQRVPKAASAPAVVAEATPVAENAAPVAAAPAPAARKTRKAPAARKAVATTAAKTAAQPADKPAKAPKAPKHKLVRDSFTIPKNEYQVLDALKQRALGLEQPVRKSELLRAGIQALAAMNDKAFVKALAAVPTLKTGRPKTT